MPCVSTSACRTLVRWMRGGWIALLLGGWIILALWPSQPAQSEGACTAPFFSEYVEGSGYNKGVEIFNGAADAVDLAGLEIHIYRDGGDQVSAVIPLTGTLPSGETWVVAHTSAEFDADFRSGSLNFNGDDGVALVENGVILDFIGDTLGDPGSAWGSGDTSTRDHTLRRLPWVSQGDADPADPFDPATEWEGHPRDTFDGLGWRWA